MRIVAFGDLHFYSLWLKPRELFFKRIPGQFNLWFNRRHHFQMELWPAVAERIREVAPEFLLSTGDFTTTALPQEFTMVVENLKPLVEKTPAFFIPGNHDRYTRASMKQRFFEEHFQDLTARSWPHHQILTENLHLVGLDPTRPNFINASGELGDEQREKLADLLQTIDPEDRIIMTCHYPVGIPTGFIAEATGHKLQDDRELVQILLDSGRRITYLHGHIHRPWAMRVQESPRVRAINLGAPLMTSREYAQGQGFVEIDTSGDRMTFTRHLLGSDQGWSTQEIEIRER
ncbi:MAG: metallophosphoesterase [Verrucomicrobiota bacterium]